MSHNIFIILRKTGGGFVAFSVSWHFFTPSQARLATNVRSETAALTRPCQEPAGWADDLRGTSEMSAPVPCLVAFCSIIRWPRSRRAAWPAYRCWCAPCAPRPDSLLLGQSSASNPLRYFIVAVKCALRFAQRATEAQPLGAQGAANLPQGQQAKEAAAVASSGKLLVRPFIVGPRKPAPDLY
jgi:hypothetical protein